MSRWHLHHNYSLNHMFPVLDPDFDEFGGELTLAQIRDPVLTWAQTWNPVSPTGGDPLGYQARRRARIYHQRRHVNSEKWGYIQGYRQKCNRCVPYNWQFTPNYWATGQDDQFKESYGR